MIDELKTILAITLTALGTNWATKVFERRKRKAEATALEKSNVATEQQIIRNKTETFQMITDDLHERLKMFKNEIRLMEEEHLEMQTDYRKRLREAKEKIDRLEDKIVELKLKACIRNCDDRIHLIKES